MRTSRYLGLAALTALTLLLAVGAWRPVHSQINAAPSWIPMGVSQSGTGSTAWFHEPGSRQAVACRTVDDAQGALVRVSCVTGRLP
jgi:hypothetical protein